MEKIGLGGGCHWCTEAVFQSLRGITKVESGWITSKQLPQTESEGVIVTFNPEEITLQTLIEIHLLTHSSASKHSMREKYISAIYSFNEGQSRHASSILHEVSAAEGLGIATQILEFDSFRAVGDDYKNYYFSDPKRPFCVAYIEPKLRHILKSHQDVVDTIKLQAGQLQETGEDV